MGTLLRLLPGSDEDFVETRDFYIDIGNESPSSPFNRYR